MMKGSLSLISWYNKGHFRFLTNGYSPTKQGGCCSDCGAQRLAGVLLTVCLRVTGVIIKRKSGEIPCPLAVEAFAAHLSYICKYDDKYSKWVKTGQERDASGRSVHSPKEAAVFAPADILSSINPTRRGSRCSG